MDKKIEDLINTPYLPKYRKECKYIWKTYVPKNGKGSNLEGELLRQLEKLRFEAQNNGNINWNKDLSSYCDNIKNTLGKMKLYTKNEKGDICLIMDYLKACGEDAQKFYEGKTSENKTYVGDDLYDIIADAIGYMEISKTKKTRILNPLAHIFLIFLAIFFLTTGMGGLIVSTRLDKYEDKGIYTFQAYGLEIEEVPHTFTGKIGRRQELKKDYYVLYKTKSKNYVYKNRVSSKWEADKDIDNKVSLEKRVLKADDDIIFLNKNINLKTYLANRRIKYLMILILSLIYLIVVFLWIYKKIRKNFTKISKKDLYILGWSIFVIIGILIIFLAYENIIALIIKTLSHIWEVRLDYLKFYSSDFRMTLSIFGFILLLLGLYLNKKSRAT